jgi:hypothetical protein
MLAKNEFLCWNTEFSYPESRMTLLSNATSLRGVACTKPKICTPTYDASCTIYSVKELISCFFNDLLTPIFCLTLKRGDAGAPLSGECWSTAWPPWGRTAGTTPAASYRSSSLLVPFSSLPLFVCFRNDAGRFLQVVFTTGAQAIFLPTSFCM